MKYTAIATNKGNVIGINNQVGHRFICYSKTPNLHAIVMARKLNVPYLGQLNQAGVTI